MPPPRVASAIGAFLGLSSCAGRRLIIGCDPRPAQSAAQPISYQLAQDVGGVGGDNTSPAARLLQWGGATAEGEATEHLLEHIVARKRDVIELLERSTR